MSTVPPKSKSLNEVLLEFAELKARLEDAEQTIDAIRSGEVDALVVRGESGDQVFTLRGADEPYRIFVERMHDGAATLDNAGMIMYCNHAFASMLAEPMEKIIGSNFKAYLQNQKLIDDEPFESSLKCRSGINVETELNHVPVICSITPVELDSPAAFAVTIVDLTEQKKHEDELTNATAELEGFCYSVSHDMRGPLRSMISGASIVLEDYGVLLPDVAQTDLNRIVSSATYLGRLMDDLLNYARLARHELQHQPVDLTAIAKRLAEDISRNEFTGVEWRIAPGLVAQGDARFLEMVLQNLLSNAAKFSANTTHPIVEFDWSPENEAFFVRDNGIGFEMQYASKLFEPFERLHTPSEYPGTGIGLANVKRIVNLHCGKVWADGRPDEGATFFFNLDSEIVG